jgi:hypothetical protein
MGKAPTGGHASKGTFRTYSGLLVSVLDPNPEDVRFEDLARALSRIQRFGGHAHKPYSVAEHSVLVSRLCLPRHALLGLLHDASEAWCGDIVTPLKAGLANYKAIERRWMRAVGIACGIGDALVDLPSDVHAADSIALQTERRDVFLDGRVDPDGHAPSKLRVVGLNAPAAYRLFVRRFRELTGVDPR